MHCLLYILYFRQVLALLVSGLTASIALAVVAGLRVAPARLSTRSDPLLQQHQQQGAIPSGPRLEPAAGSLPPKGGAAAAPVVLVTAAAGGTGQFAVQLAALAGAHVVATCGGPAKARCEGAGLSGKPAEGKRGSGACLWRSARPV